MARIEYSRDLNAPYAVNHSSCSVKFGTGRYISDGNEPPTKKKRKTKECCEGGHCYESCSVYSKQMTKSK